MNNTDPGGKRNGILYNAKGLPIGLSQDGMTELDPDHYTEQDKELIQNILKFRDILLYTAEERRRLFLITNINRAA